MNKIVIDPKNILARLKAGETREEVVTSLGLSGKDAKALFQHPLLKGKRTEKALSFVFVDDEETSTEEVQEVVAEEVVELDDNNTIETVEAEEIIAENTEVKTETFWSK